MSGVVFDAYSVIAYIEREPGYEHVEACLERAARAAEPILFCVVNWGEVYYSILREAGHRKAEEAKQVIETLPIEIIMVDLLLTQQAAIYKASYKMSYADCFAAALAKFRHATLMTGDKEFRQVEGDVKIAWL